MNAPAPAYTIDDQGAAVVITIPAPRDYIYLTLYGLGFLFWLFIILAPVTNFNRNVFHPVGAVNIALAAVFLIGFPIYLVLSILWALTGREIVTIAGGEVRVRRELAGLGRTRKIELARLAQVYLARDRANASARFSPSARVRGGPICLEEKAAAPSADERYLPPPPALIRFGAGLNLADARAIASLIRDRAHVKA